VKEKVFSPLYLLIGLLLVLMLVFGTTAYIQAKAYEEATTKLVELQAPTEQAKLQLERLATSLVGDYFSGTRDGNYTVIEKKQQRHKFIAQDYTRYFMYILGALLLSFIYLTLQEYTFLGAVLAFITLFFGLISPLLMVTIHKEVEYLGDIVLSFESKGVIGSIMKLFESGDIVVALVILIFSVIVPLLKVGSLLFISIFVEHQFAEKIVKFFKAIGKWSMVDVFVVAVFLVYLTANKGNVTRAEVEVGLYFFLAYVLVSMLTSMSADKMLRELRAKTKVHASE
jgi:hypothetical protein